ncbi:12913_t:CDS:2 [Gigaspora rosea]|nr:12913_t:CDS:2 [Gigaspora rosea]
MQPALAKHHKSQDKEKTRKKGQQLKQGKRAIYGWSNRWKTSPQESHQGFTQRRHEPNTSTTTAAELPANTSGLRAGRKTTQESRHNGSSPSTHHLTNYQHTENAPSISLVGDNNQICTIIDSVNTTITINSSPTYLPKIPRPPTCTTPNTPINTIEGSQNIKNIELCISIASTIRSRASTPTPKPTYSQVTARGRKYNQIEIDEIEQWTRGATKVRAQQTRDYFNTEDFIQHKSKLEFDEMRRAISDAFTDTLTDLPASPDEIPYEIREELPFELSILDKANTRPIVLALRKLYKFDKLPDNYFKRRYALPQDLQDLVDWINILPEQQAPTTTTHGDNKPALPDTVDEIKQTLSAGKEDTIDTQKIELPITTHT